jgi:uncharacterized spore protein YtfJ
MDDEKDGRQPFQVQTVHGEPYTIAGRTLIPVARIFSFGRARGSVGPHRFEGRGLGFVWVSPMAVIVKTDGGERRIRLTDSTLALLRTMLGVALSSTLAFAAVRFLLRWRFDCEKQE